MGIFDKFKKNKGGDKKIPMPMYLYDDAEISSIMCSTNSYHLMSISMSA